jgi:hypothetical protein
MKTPEEWQDKLEYVFIKQKTIAEIQDEAWNAALDAAAESARTNYYEIIGSEGLSITIADIDKKSILKLKK